MKWDKLATCPTRIRKNQRGKLDGLPPLTSVNFILAPNLVGRQSKLSLPISLPVD